MGDIQRMARIHYSQKADKRDKRLRDNSRYIVGIFKLSTLDNCR
jgi:hypothetical protein